MYVCIDVGHGGPDSGGTGFGITEKSVTAEVAARVGELLHAAGCVVFLTRIGDQRVSLPQRIRAAQGTGADLFLSLHCGRSSRPDQRGIKVFYSRGNELSQVWAEMVASAVEQRLNGRTVARGARPLHWRRRMGAARLLKAVRAQMPACRVELGYLSNPQDARLLQERLFLDDLARGLAGAALAWRQCRDGSLGVGDGGFTTETRRHGGDTGSQVGR